MKRILKIILPVVVLLIGVTAAGLMILYRKPIQANPTPVLPPLVKVLEVQSQAYQIRIQTQGTVRPRTEIQVVPEVSGRVVHVSPSFEEGGFFEEDEVLLKLDPRDFELSVTRAKAQRAEARYKLTLEEAEAQVARQEWEALGGNPDKPNALAVRALQLTQAQAVMASAEAALEEAERNLERSEFRAPFAGRVGEKHIDAGEFVTRGAPVARIYSVDYAEVRLPLSSEQLAFVDIPLDFRTERREGVIEGPEVVLSANYAGRTNVWHGRIVRSEGEIDTRTRMVFVIAQVADPFGHGVDGNQSPLAMGLFVNAEILGHFVENVFVVPRSTLRGKDRVLIVDADNRLQFQSVQVLRTDRTESVIRSGLTSGDRVCLTPLDTVAEGMKVRLEGEAKIDLGTGDSSRVTKGSAR